ncbi:MAG: sodium-translocating pyrophosphatase [Anaerolineaceae bacterium 4572_32.1]|nr:MAG: sodium-translocating pyrophosphatase [Anaerolineaceae bacterium 4572_32.1]
MQGLQGTTTFEQFGLYAVLATAVAALLYAWWLAREVLHEDPGTEAMQEISTAIREGAVAYLNKQMEVVIPLSFVLAIALFLTAHLADAPWSISIGRGAALLLGASCSLAIGQIGLRYIGTRGNVRVAQQARKGSFQGALRVAYRSGTIAGMLADGLGLLGGTIIFLLYGKHAPEVLLGFGFGGTLLAMFMRVGGGIYTKAADVGADLVGKVEAGIPEDDPRNAAVIADLVGDNVGDFSGMAEDVFESYEVTIVSAMILGLAVMQIDPAHSLKWIVFPLLVRAIGVFSSIIGTYAVSWWPTKGDAFRAMDLSYDLSSIISTTSFFFLAWFYAGDLRLFAATAAGILLAVGFNKYTASFTEIGTAAVNKIVRSTRTGPATTILSGLSVGYESTVWAIMIIVLNIMLSIAIYSVTIPASLKPYIIGGAVALGLGVGVYLAQSTKKIENGVFGAVGILVLGLIFSSFQRAPAGHEFIFIMYSVAMAGIGMLSHTGNNLAMDAFGPIADNAQGISEMCKGDFDDPKAHATLADLDAVGNTTKAITKGIAIASAVIAAVSLFASYIETTGLEGEGLNLAEPIVFIGVLIGGALPFLFSSVLLNAVERAAALIIEEVRRQFHIPGVLEGTVKPAYDKVVRICTDAAQRELIVVAMLGILVPIVVGFLIGEKALGGFLAGIIVTGQLLAVFMANSGGAWDNAKKQIEAEPSDPERNMGKGSERHKASVIGDTVGDPLKDTAGPALNPMIKVVNLVSLLIAPLMISVSAQGGTARTITYVVSVLFIIALAAGIGFSKREAKPLID